FLAEASIGPELEETQFCELLFQRPSQIPENTLMDGDTMDAFHNSLRNQSARRLLIDLHPLLFPGADAQVIRGRRNLASVIDGYDDLWAKSHTFIYETQPCPSHTRGLRPSLFTEAQRRKLGIEPDKLSFYAATEEIYFPYLVGLVTGDFAVPDIADEEATHCMSIALRGLVHLARMAGCAESLHRQILGFSLSHDLDTVSIYGYYPIIEGTKTTYCRRLIRQFDIWTDKSKWDSYSFVYNVDEVFLPRHIRRV
ncbi:uncharacterized protein BO80DRAFT_314416, partial [Aspergillus ibericus CBS 121593]